jgi:phospholipase C
MLFNVPMMKSLLLYFGLSLGIYAHAAIPVQSSATKEIPAWEKIRHTVVIILENTEFHDAVRQPFLGKIAKKGALLSNYYGVTHPSQPNYIALIAGNTHGVNSNHNYSLSQRHLGDLFLEKGKTWKTYVENYPGECYLKATAQGSYVRKHVPVLSFTSVQNNPALCKRVVEAKEFKKDLDSYSLPEFSLYIPSNDSNGHDTGIAHADAWIAKTFGKVFENSNALKDTLFVITFDEGSYQENNQVYTLLYGAGVQPGATSQKRYNHYSLLRTIEKIYGLASLGQNDDQASTISDIWSTSHSAK